MLLTIRSLLILYAAFGTVPRYYLQMYRSHKILHHYKEIFILTISVVIRSHLLEIWMTIYLLNNTFVGVCHHGSPEVNMSALVQWGQAGVTPHSSQTSLSNLQPWVWAQLHQSLKTLSVSISSAAADTTSEKTCQVYVCLCYLYFVRGGGGCCNRHTF